MPYDSPVSPELEWLRNCKFDTDSTLIDTVTYKIDSTYHK